MTQLTRKKKRRRESRKIGIKKGVNVIGRDDLPFTDKRLSRKHLSLTHHDHHATLQLIVEGTNPVVIRSKDQRKKLLSREKLTIRDGDIIELIPGHYLYKYKAFDGVTKRSSPNTQKRPLIQKVKDESITQKRLRQVSEDEVIARRLQTEMDVISRQ
ncbi:tyrosyl-DNA phosphodiesterase 1 isoform X1 [Tanacetum coccineum]